MGIIVSSFRGCGRTFFKNITKGKVKVFDAVVGLENGLPEDYFERILSVVDDNDVVFVNFDKIVRDQLEELHVDYDLFYPSKNRRLEFLENQVRKKADRKEIQELDLNFDKWIDEVEEDKSPHCYKHKLPNIGEFLGNNPMLMGYINAIIERNQTRQIDGDKSTEQA